MQRQPRQDADRRVPRAHPVLGGRPEPLSGARHGEAARVEQGEERTFFVRPGPDPVRELEPRGPARRRAPPDVRPRGREPPPVGVRDRRSTSPGRASPGRSPSRAPCPVYVAEAAVRALSERLFFDTFKWTTAVFTVTPLDAAPDVPAKMDRPTGGLLLEALRRLPAPASQLNSPLDPGSRPVFAPDILLRYQAVARLGGGGRSAREGGRDDDGGADPPRPADRRPARGDGPPPARRPGTPHREERRRPKASSS